MGGVSPPGGADSDTGAQTSADEVGAVSLPAVRSKWTGRVGLAVGALPLEPGFDHAAGPRAD